MNYHLKSRRVVCILLVALLTVTLTLPMTLTVSAANRRFITEIRVEAGADAIETMEADGWSVLRVGLNVTPNPSNQVYLAFKTNTGAPITNVMVLPDSGDSYTDKNGIVYFCVSHVDVDMGIGEGAGCIYATRDERAGAPLVGIDVLRGNIENGDILYPITNDGAEIVRTPSGTPADLEAGGDSDYIYLAQIRDGIVRPYISEIGVVTDTDKWNAVYTACERGYNYFVEGDIDNSTETYTIIAYDRTADLSQAITNIIAVSEQTIRSIEETTGGVSAAVSISGVQYVKVSGKPVSSEQSYYLYMTKDSKAGNPVSMLFAESPDQNQNFMFGMWANSYFFSPGATTAYTYSMNEDLYLSLWEDQTVCTKIPVKYLNDYTNSSSIEPVQDVTEENPEVTTEQPSDNQEETAEKTGQETTEPAKPEADPAKGSIKYVNLTMLTPSEGLPVSVGRVTGITDPVNITYVERTQRSDRVNKYQASIFGTGGIIALIVGGVAIVCASTIIIIKKNTGKKSSGKLKKAGEK